ncbi:sporulation inhibitor of replication protein SirA [Anaerobacillus alkaliphilus]|uniref:Sporulation inhibitor of replication protein SirA n=1 Tax=Anaerobacillus alkaliphilus TaxID=1548597 RepID=A0A4V1LFY8_9BACI|nr:sporulation inhibitor of replication protein SirA [Anaerobacillus alkaliphilus]RXI97914.1 sporulation inhibitor of replication protein SirA [Anaerobacillus alkaliphilus]
MRHYYIYLLKPEIASNYFGKEWLIYQLFVEGETAKKDLRTIAQKQINYISGTIPTLQIKKNLDKALRIRNDFYVLKEHYYIDIKALESKAVLKDHGNMLTISASGSYQAETVFFEVLRQINPAFFAMDFENRNYGWLNPVKQVNYI